MSGGLAHRGMRTHSDYARGRPCGTRLKYMGGCRCLPCRCANANYERERLKARREGDWNGIVPSTKALRHVRSLSKRGIGYKTVAKISCVSSTIVFEIRTGRRPRIRKRTERKLLAVTGIGDQSGGTLVDAAETWQLIELFVEEGFSHGQISRELGYRHRALQFGKERV